MMEIMMKGNKEYIRLYRMPGSRTGQVPEDKRDFSFKPGIGPWGNPIDFVGIVIKMKKRGEYIDGLALIDEIDNPGEVKYIEVE